jgi:general secretion pathway protein G
VAKDNKNAATARRRQRGFTLIELLVVLVILGLISAFAAPQVIKYLGSAKRDSAKVQIDRLGSVLDLYRLEVGSYPTESQGLSALVEKPAGVNGWNGPYLKKAETLTDPWGTPYQYRYPGEHGQYDLWTFGADGQPGGEGENADITSW